jgi:hypothetical protein
MIGYDKKTVKETYEFKKYQLSQDIIGKINNIILNYKPGLITKEFVQQLNDLNLYIRYIKLYGYFKFIITRKELYSEKINIPIDLQDSYWYIKNIRDNYDYLFIKQ